MGLFSREPEVPDTIGDKAGKAQLDQPAPAQRFTAEHVRLAKAAEQQRRRGLS